MSDRWQVEELKRRVPLAELIGRDISLKKKGKLYWACCPFHNERSPSFTVDERGFYRCFGCGQNGDHFSWLQDKRQMDFIEAKRELMRLANIDPHEWERVDPAAAQQAQTLRQSELDMREARENERMIGHAYDIWRQSVPAAGTLVETYLAGRGISLKAVGYPPTLRFHPALAHSDLGTSHPAMVAYIQGPQGQFVGVHRTYLNADGSDKLKAQDPKTGEPIRAKKMLGPVWQAAVRFAKAAPVMAIGEGIETCLSVLQAQPGLSVWAALSLGNIAGGGEGRGNPHPYRDDARLPPTVPDMERPGIILPECVRSVVILADNDNKDSLAAMANLQRAANRWRKLGMQVLVAIPPDGMDFNDWWIELQKQVVA